MVSLLAENLETHFCRFYADTEAELDLLPTHSHGGKGRLYSMTSCAFGSIAKCGNGKMYILSGDDTWTEDKRNTSGGGTTIIEENIEPIPDELIESLF